MVQKSDYRNLTQAEIPATSKLQVDHWYFLAGVGPMLYDPFLFNGVPNLIHYSNIEGFGYFADEAQVVCEVSKEYAERWETYRKGMIDELGDSAEAERAWREWVDSDAGKAATLEEFPYKAPVRPVFTDTSGMPY